MKKQNHTLGQRCMAYILLIGLFLQSCNNPYVGPRFNKQEPITKEERPNSTTLFLETPSFARELEAPIEKEKLVNQRVDAGLEDELATTAKPKDPQSQLEISGVLASSTQGRGLATKPGTTTLKPSQLSQTSSKLPSKEKPQSKPVRKRLQAPNPLHARAQQVKAPSTSLIIEQAPQGTKQALEKAPMLTEGRFQIKFEKTSEGLWKAIVNESFQVGISRKIELPVFFELGYNFSHLADSHWVHVVEEGAGSFIWIGSVGIKGGMYQEEADDNNNKSNKNSAKAEEIPTDLSGKLKYLYKYDDTLPRLIEVEDNDQDERIGEQSIQDYYVKLQVVLQENFEQGRRAAAKDQVVGEKKPIEVEKLFDEIDKEHPAVSKVLLLGGAGIGKSTLMHYISHQWAQGKLWKDKYDHVFRVRLKDMLDPNWLTKYAKTEEREKNLLACFIHNCLDNQKVALKKKGNKQIRGVVYKLSEIKQLLEDPSKKEKVLLLVDGYDEVASLKGNVKYEILDEGVFEHPQVIMTSRPHAAKKDVRGKFERQIESQGLDEAGINRYIDLQFKGNPALGKELKDFLSSNSQVRSMCEVPINTALLGITWRDEDIRNKFTSSQSMQTDFKLGELYQELIVWLGKRYAIKHGGVQDIDELSMERVLDDQVLKGLELIAYKAFTGQLGNQAQSSGVLGIPGKSIDKVAREVNSKLSISELHKYGLLRGEGDPNKPLEQTYYFIHLTFQEYLTAYHLCHLLSQEDKVKEVATWIAHHRNEPKYLMTFKFLAGLVSQSKDEQLVRRFWEAMSCNVDGVIELGIEGKVKLFMHLLSQSKLGGQFDNRIPHIAQIAKLVDGTLQGDLVKWEQDIIEAGYFPTWLQEKASKDLEQGIGLARKASLSEEAKMRLQAAANLLSKIVNQGGTLPREQLLHQFIQLIALKDWQLQKLGLEKAREVVDRTVPAQKLEESAKDIVHLLVDANLQKAAYGLFVKLGQIAKPVLKHLMPLLAGSDYDVRIRAADALIEIVKLVPGKEVLKALNPLLADSNKGVRSSAADALIKIVKLVPELGKEVLEALNPLLAHSNEGVRSNAAYALEAIVKFVPELGKEVWEALKTLLADSNDNVRIRAADALKEIVESVPGLGKEVLEGLKPMLAHSDWHVRESTTKALRAIVKSAPGLAKEVLETLKPLLADENYHVRYSACNTLDEIVELVPELSKEVTEALKPLPGHSHADVRYRACNILSEIVKLMPEIGKEVLAALKPLLADKDSEVRRYAAIALGEIVESAPELGKEVLEALKPLLADKNDNVRRSVADALVDIMKSMPELSTEVWKALNPLLADENDNVRRGVAVALGDSVKSAPGLRKEVLAALKPLLADENDNVRSLAADALKKIINLMPGKEALEALNPLLADENDNVRSSAADALKEIVKLLVPELAKEVWETLKPLLADSNKYVRIRTAYALEKIIESAPELRKEVWKTLKALLADENDNVRTNATDALGIIVELLVPELGKEVLEALKPLLTGENKDVGEGTAKALRAIVQSAPGLRKEVWEVLKPLLADSHEDVRRYAADSLEEIVQSAPELGKEVWEALQPLLADENDNPKYVNNVRRSAVWALLKIVKLVPGLEKECFESLKPLVVDQDRHVKSLMALALPLIVQALPELGKECFGLLKSLLADRVSDSAYALSDLVKFVPELRKEVLEALKPLLADSKQGFFLDEDDEERLESSAAEALGYIVQSMPFIQQVDLLADAHPAVRQAVKEALIGKFKTAEKIAHQELGSLIKLIVAYQGSPEHLDKELYVAANKALQQLAGTLDPNGIQWLNAHFTELPTLPMVQTFLKAVVAKTLEDKILDEQEAALLIKCIVERGLTATINPEANQIVLEDNTYTLQPASQQALNHVVNQVIRLSKDAIAAQYKAHTPLFKNSGEALPLATADIEQVVSILDKEPLNSESWHVSVLDLSDHRQAKPSATFILLEQRNYAGAHVIHQLKLDKGEGKVSSHAINPLAVDHLREALFGPMAYIITKPRYHGYSFTLSQELGEKLLEAAQQIKPREKAYNVLHELAGKYEALQANQKTTSGLLSLAWEEYAKHPAVKGYKKEEVLAVDANQVRRDSDAIASQEQLQAHKKELEEHRGEIKGHKKELEAHEEEIKVHKKELEEDKKRIEAQDNKVVALVGQVSKHEQQISDQHIRLDKQESQVAAHEHQIKGIQSILEVSGVKENAAIKEKLQDYQTKEKELFDYCTTFIWTLKAYMDAYLVSSSGILSTNQESSKAEEVAYKTGRNVVTGALDLVPFVGGFLSGMVGDTLDSTRDAIHQAKQDNKIAAINALMSKDHTLTSELEHSIAQAALKVVELKKAAIKNPPVVAKSRLGELGGKISALTDKLLKNHQIAKSPQAELAVKDVVALMIRLYQEYELVNENRTKGTFADQLAELVCVGSLEDMVAQSANRLDVSLVSGVFQEKTLQKLREKAAKGLWEATRLKLGKECEEFFEEKYITDHLANNKPNPVAISRETISASRAVLFKAMCEGMVATKEKKPEDVLVCAKGFAKKYPALTKQIATDYPGYFKDRRIAAECIEDPALLAAVQSKLSPTSRFK